MSYFSSEFLREIQSGNLVTNSRGDSGTTGWTRYKVNGADKTKPYDFAASPDAGCTFTTESATAVSDANFLYQKSAGSNFQGNGVYFEFSPRQSHRAAILRLVMDYVVDGAYTDGIFGVYLVSSTDNFSSVINVQEFSQRDIPAVSLVSQFLSEVQTYSADTKCRLCIHVQGTGTANNTLQFSDLFLGKREIARGPVVTDWTAWTPNVYEGANNKNADFSSRLGFWRRVGSDIELSVMLLGTAGARSGTGAFQIDLPSVAMKTASIADASRSIDGFMSSSVGTYDTQISTSGAASRIYAINKGVGQIAYNDTTLNPASVELAIHAKFPVTGWESSSVVSSDFGGRLITAYGAGNGGGSVTASVTNVDFTEVSDSTSSWSGSVFTAPEAGDYVFSGSVLLTGAADVEVRAYKNGSNHKAAGRANADCIPFKCQVSLSKGDTLSFRLSSNQTLSNSSTRHTLACHKVQSPQTMLGSEKVQVFAHTSTTSVNNALSPRVKVVFTTKTRDTHNAYNASTGEFTVPIGGWYTLKAAIASASTTLTTAQSWEIRVQVGGSDDAQLNRVYGNGAAHSQIISGSYSNYYEKGTVLAISSYQDTGGAVALNGSATLNWLAIEKD